MFERIVSAGVNRLRHNRLLSTIYHEARLRSAIRSHATPILIYQMGKVGSNSILGSLKAAKIGRPIFHVHFLNPNNLSKAGTRLRNIFGNYGSVNRWALYESRFVIRHFLQRPINDLKIISLVREPVSRNISSFFANLDIFIPDCAARFDKGQLDIAAIERSYLRDFHEHLYPLDWFDEEVHSVFGIDVFSDENLVRRRPGEFRFSRDQVELLVLRVEDIDSVAPRALQEFLGIEKVALTVANEAQTKTYNRVYRAFKDRLRLPEEYLARMYESKFATRFYSASEIDRFRERWSKC